MRDSVDGASVAPASPITARLAMSISALVENAASTEAMPNAAAPIRSSLRRPIRSPSVPIVMSDPATMNPRNQRGADLDPDFATGDGSPMPVRRDARDLRGGQCWKRRSADEAAVGCSGEGVSDVFT
jgi:hypothetical protein